MPVESRQTEKRVIFDKKILSKKTRDRYWRSCCGLTYKQKHFSGFMGNLQEESIYNGNFSGVADTIYWEKVSTIVILGYCG